MASNLYNRYLWLAETIFRLGPVTFAEINKQWSKSSLYNGRSIALRTFHNHRDAIEELLDIIILCDPQTNRYYIENSDDIGTNQISEWVLNSFSVNAALREAKTLQERILIDNIPSSSRFLTDILEAMRQNHQIIMFYQSFTNEAPVELLLQPLFVKIYERRWYLYADRPDDTQIKLYALDRILSIHHTDNRFVIQKDFSPEEYLSGAFGVTVYSNIKPCRIRIKSRGNATKYLRTLPLHKSQKEVETHADYAVFEYWVAPTGEFYSAILARSTDLEVIYPAKLRTEIKSRLSAISAMYE